MRTPTVVPVTCLTDVVSAGKRDLCCCIMSSKTKMFVWPDGVEIFLIVDSFGSKGTTMGRSVGYSIEILDFSDAFWRGKGETTPRQRGGKFVVMRRESGKADYLVLFPVGHGIFHTDIVERFCRLERFRIDGDRSRKSGGFAIHDPDWSVVCGGRWEWNEETMRLRLYGSSQAYGTCKLASLKKRIARVPEMKGWKIDTDA